MSRTGQRGACEQARAAAREARARRARNARFGMIGGLCVAAVAVVGLAVAQSGSGSGDEGSVTAGGVLTGPPPWPAQAVGLQERVGELGFPPVRDESYHAHALLSVFRNGEQIPVPADLGYDERGAHTSLHTHTPDGVIHMEADGPYPYQLAHVMTTWGVAFDSNRLGGDTASGDRRVHI